MSNRERCDAILDSFSEAQLVNVAAMLQAMRQTIDDLEDEAFCQRMIEDYERDQIRETLCPLRILPRSWGFSYEIQDCH